MCWAETLALSEPTNGYKMLISRKCGVEIGVMNRWCIFIKALNWQQNWCIHCCSSSNRSEQYIFRHGGTFDMGPIGHRARWTADLGPFCSEIKILDFCKFWQRWQPRTLSGAICCAPAASPEDPGALNRFGGPSCYQVGRVTTRHQTKTQLKSL